MTTCLQSVQSMGAITMLISLFLYMFAVIGRGLYAEVDPGRFGNLGSAMLTLFQLLTLDDWFYIFMDAVAIDQRKHTGKCWDLLTDNYSCRNCPNSNILAYATDW